MTFKDQTADFVSNLAALLSTTRDQRQPAGEGMPVKLEKHGTMNYAYYDLTYLPVITDI